MKKILPSVLIALAILLYLASAPQDQSTADVLLSDTRITHILYGDETGGGHLHGTGTPCKSEFPADWNEEKIIQTTKSIAANDNLNWRQEQNGYFVTEDMTDGVNVRVVLDPQRSYIITAYPTNVPRNPCPANDN